MQFPGPVRAVVGLLASAAEEAKHLPDRAIELPMLAVSTALQASLRAQQRYARLAARGDEVLHRRPPTDEPPAWATFDEPVPIDQARRGAVSAVSDEQARAASDLLDELLGPESTEPTGPAEPAPRKAPAKKAAPAKRAAAAKKAPAKRAADVGKSVNQPRHTAPSRFDAVGDADD